MRAITCLAAVLVVGLHGCGGEPAPSHVATPGEPPTAETQILEAGAAALQDKEPVDALNVYLDGFHFYNDDMRGQMEAHHYCSVLNEDVRQCVIFDGTGPDAKLTGVEYVLSRRVFEQLPAEERKLWHSHVHEVKGGLLLAPGLPEGAEHELMQQMVDTYGKTWHTWHADRHDGLPIGHPLLMAGFTADGQIDPALVAVRDRRIEVSTAERRQSRDDIAMPEIVDGADAWQRGEVLQVTLQQTIVAPEQESNRLQAEPDDEPPAPTRRIRARRAHQLYAVLPPPTSD